MNEDVSRALDRWVGKPLCGLLTGWRRLREALAKPPVSASPRRILFVKLSEMGAILLAVPAFEAARSRVGRANLYCLMLHGNLPILDLIDLFPSGNILTIRDSSLFAFAWDTLRLMWRCRREGIDTVIDLEGFARISAILCFLTGARKRVGLHRYTAEAPYRGDLFTHRVALNYYNHASVQFLTLVEALDAPEGEWPLHKRRIELKDFRLAPRRPHPGELAAMEALLEERCGRIPGRPRILLNCNLIDALPLRRWPRGHFLELGRRLLEHSPGATLLLTGLDAEREPSRALAREISPERAFSLAGETRTLGSLVALFTLADLLVTSDCGPAHMAAVTDIPIVSIFGPETPQLYAPLSPNNHSLWAGLACSPCLNAFNHRRSPCRRNICMEQVTVEEVYALARRLCPGLEARSAGRSGRPGAPSAQNATPLPS